MTNEEIVERKMAIKPITYFCQECDAKIVFRNNADRHNHKTERIAEFSVVELYNMLNEARADERKQLADRMKLIDAQTKSLPQLIQDDTEFITKLKKEAYKEIFSLLDHIAQIEHGTNLESCLIDWRSKDSQRILREFKKKMGIE